MLPANPGGVVFAGRLFDFHVLDMIELGIEKFASLSDIKVKRPHGPSQILQLSVLSSKFFCSSLNVHEVTDQNVEWSEPGR